eukprot:11207913-Ditylum_brightwellii.AAC.1
MTNDPADIPTSVKDIDPNAMESLLTHEDLEKLWHKDQVTISDDIRLYLYWHQRFQHPHHVSMVWLAERKVIPSAIRYIQKAPPCAACLFAKAQRRAWRNQRKKLKFIRKKHHTNPGDGTSADHVILHQPGLIPQVTGRLSHEKFWGRGTTVEENLAAKGEYERVLHECGHK